MIMASRCEGRLGGRKPPSLNGGGGGPPPRRRGSRLPRGGGRGSSQGLSLVRDRKRPPDRAAATNGGTCRATHRAADGSTYISTHCATRAAAGRPARGHLGSTLLRGRRIRLRTVGFQWRVREESGIHAQRLLQKLQPVQPSLPRRLRHPRGDRRQEAVSGAGGGPPLHPPPRGEGRVRVQPGLRPMQPG